MTREVRLRGGFMQKVVRVGDTVRRAPRGNVAFIRALLGHLDATGFTDAPRWLGSDEKGRDIFSYMEGDVPRQLGHFDDVTLEAAARFIRRYHDATISFVGAGQVACHNDLSPCNFAFRDGVPRAIIDFDNAAEGDRMPDLAYAGWTWLDIGNEDDYAPEEQLRRLRLFARAYGGEIDIPALIDTILVRQAQMMVAPFPWHLRHGFRAWCRRGQTATLRIKALL